MNQTHKNIAFGILAVCAVIFIFAIGSRAKPPATAHASFNGYTYYRTITVTSTPSVASGTLTNFPMFFSGTYGWLAASSSVSASGTLQNTNGYDMIFATSSACSPSLNFQIENYNSSTGAIVAWVQVPTMSAGTVIDVCYDNPSITTSQANATATWSNQSLGGYWQMDEGMGSSTIDMSGNGHSGTWTGTASGTFGYYSPGVIGQWAGDFNGVNNLVNLGIGTGLAETSTLTLSAWINMSSVIQTYIVSKSPGTVGLDYELKLTSPKLQLALGTAGTARATGSTTIQANQWYFVAGTYDGTSTADVYVNGLLNGTTVATGTLNADSASAAEIGNRSGSGVYFPGSIDDVRIYGRTLSPSEILTMYNNQSSPSTFYTIGTPGSTDTWIAGSASNWNNGANWSNGIVPGPTTIALFSASSSANCTIDAAINVQGLTIASGYAGAIAQSSGNTISIGSSGFSEASGTFTGDTAGDSIAVTGPFSLTGGTFTGTAGNLTLASSSDIFSGNSFHNNSGTVILADHATPITLTGSSTMYVLSLGDGTSNLSTTITVATGTTLTVQSSTIFRENNSQIYLLGGGAINAGGNVLLNSLNAGISTAPTGTFRLVLNGSGAQFINDQGGSSAANPFYLPSVIIDKVSGVAYAEGNTIIITGNVFVKRGEFQLATSTATTTVQVLGAVTVASGSVLSDYPAVTSTIDLGTSVTNNGLVFFDGSGESCTSIMPDYVVINSTTTGSQVPWAGTGNFIMRYADIADQGGTSTISVVNGTTTGSDVGANWIFTNGPEPQLIQSSTAGGGSGTTQLTLPAFGFKPRAGDLIIVAVSAKNQAIVAPTDNASNTYVLVASSTFGSSPSYSLSLYYAKNITPSSSLAVTVGGSGGTGQLLSASAFEYTGIDPSSSLDTYSPHTDSSESATSLTSFTAAGSAANELYFGALTFDASTTATSGSGWIPEAGITNNNTTQAVYVEDLASSSQLTTAATWTSAASTSYAAIMGIFHAPFEQPYDPMGTLDSATFDTGVASGAQLNSFFWQGLAPSNSGVKFQFAVSNSSSGPWNFEGPDGTAATYFSGLPGVPVGLASTVNGYAIFSGYRYFRYRATLFADSSNFYTPTVTQVTVNWSP
jgi:hypothetical protein